MILTEVYKNVDDIEDISSYHIETALVRSDELMKTILRVESDHGNEFGIRLSENSERLENGSAFKLSDHELLVLNSISDQMIVITPDGIDQMGILAHMLGNLHKPVQVKEGRIALMVDKVVQQTLEHRGIDYTIEEIQLDEPLRYVDLSNG